MSDVNNRLDNIDKRLYDMTEVLARNTEILNEHHRRTTLNEQRIEFIEKHVLLVNAAIKVIGILFAGIIAFQQLGLFDAFISLIKQLN